MISTSLQDGTPALNIVEGQAFPAMTTKQINKLHFHLILTTKQPK
jgi:hypothetical protein